jgi:hypothetical protein
MLRLTRSDPDGNPIDSNQPRTAIVVLYALTVMSLRHSVLSCAASFEDTQCILDHLLIYISRYEHDACTVIVAGPSAQSYGRVENVLHAVNDDGMRRVFDDVDNAFHAQEIVSAHRTHQIQPGRKSGPRDWLLTDYAKGPDPIRVTVAIRLHRMSVLMVR